MEETLKSNEESSGDKEEGKTGKDESEVSVMYLLTKWEGRMGKYLARGHGVLTERSEVHALLTKSQIFSHPAKPNLVNKYFII